MSSWTWFIPESDLLPHAQAAGEMRCVVVEDYADAREILTELFAAHGIQAEGAASAEEALDVVARFRPDVAILDVRLPGMSGLDLARALRADPLQRHIGLIAASASSFAGAAGEAGFDAYVLKPVVPVRLVEAVVGLAGIARARRG